MTLSDVSPQTLTFRCDGPRARLDPPLFPGTRGRAAAPEPCTQEAGVLRRRTVRASRAALARAGWRFEFELAFCPACAALKAPAP